MRNKFAVIIGAVAFLTAICIPNQAQAQANIFKGLGAGNRVKVGTSGEAAAVVKAAVTSSAGAVTVTGGADVVKVTTESLTTAAGANYTLTITNSQCTTASNWTASLAWGAGQTTGLPVITRVTPGNGSLVVIVTNIHASAALNGSLVITTSKESP